VRIFTRTPGGRPFELSPGKFYDWQRDAQSFEGMAMYRFEEFALSGTGTARAIEAGAVAPGRRADAPFAKRKARQLASPSSS
jgi:hypothetical protein